jgi:hypothetical protein
MKQMMGAIGKIEVDVEVSKLVEALKKHKEEHIVEYKTARANFEVKYVEAAKAALKNAKAGEFKGVSAGFGLVVPVDVTEDFEDLISTFEAIQSPSIKLDVQQLNTILNNSWDFVVAAKMSNASYSSSF